jgi:CBS domain-containing protein
METFVAERPPFVFLSDLLGSKVDFLDGRRGRIVDLTAVISEPYPQIRHALLRFRRRKEPVPVPWARLSAGPRGTWHIEASSRDLAVEPIREDETPLAGEILDRQVVDTAGAKLERVNDIHMLGSGRDLRLVHVDVGFRGFFRRLGFLRPTDLATELFFSVRFPEGLIPWKSIQPLAVDRGGGLRLAVAGQQLSDIHPAELADIIEDVSHDEAAALLSAVEPEVAAEAVAMLDEKDQAAVLEAVGDEDAADVLEELPADQTADILADLPQEQARELMDELEPAYAAEVRAALAYHERSAGGLMTSDFVCVPLSGTAGTALEQLRPAATEKKFISYFYCLDPDGRLAGVASLTALLATDPATPLREIARDHFASADADLEAEQLLELFKKFRVQAIPVLDEEGRPLGVVLFRNLMFETVEELAE